MTFIAFDHLLFIVYSVYKTYTIMQPDNDPIFISEVYSSLVDSIKKENVDVKSPTDIMTKGAEILDRKAGLTDETKKSCLIQVIEEFVKGKDGVLGTDDDLIPHATLESLRIMIDGGLIEDIAKLVLTGTQGRLDVEAAKKASRKCANIWCLCFAGRKQHP
jgi:hypothetical protein